MTMLTVNSFWFLVVSCGALLAACAQPQPGPTATAAVAQFGPAVAATNTTGPPTATSTPPPLPTPTPTIPHLYVIGAHITLGGWSPDSRWLAYWLAGDDDLRGLDAYDAPGGTLHLLNSRSKESCALPQFHATTWGRYSLAWENGDSLVVQDWENNEQRRGQLCRPAPLPAWENRRCRTKRPQMWACRPTTVSAGRVTSLGLSFSLAATPGGIRRLRDRFGLLYVKRQASLRSLAFLRSGPSAPGLQAESSSAAAHLDRIWIAFVTVDW
jgi:hypothetical protein